jgi:biotin transport system substrate-specific component
MTSAEKNRVNLFQLAMVGLFTAFLIVSAFIRIPMPIGVPFTGQTLAVLLAPMVLGPRYGFAVTALYFILGLFFPIYANGGGPGYYLTPSFGFLIGFMACAVPVGIISRKNTLVALIIAGFVGDVIIYLFGWAYFWGLMNFVQDKEVTLLRSAMLVVVPFIPTGILKMVLAALVAWKLKKIIPRLGNI